MHGNGVERASIGREIPERRVALSARARRDGTRERIYSLDKRGAANCPDGDGGALSASERNGADQRRDTARAPVRITVGSDS
jgi:hypothetical protein